MVTGLSSWLLGHVLAPALAHLSVPLCLPHIMQQFVLSSARRPMCDELSGEAWSGVLVGAGVEGLGGRGV